MTNSKGGSHRQIPQSNENEDRIQDLVKPGPEHRLDDARPYDEKFFDLKSIFSKKESAETEEQSAASIRAIRDKTGQMSLSALEETILRPLPIRKGTQQVVRVLRGKPIALTAISNAGNTDLNTTSKADISLLASKFNKDKLSATFMDLRFDSPDTKKDFFEKLVSAREQEHHLSSNIPKQLVKQLNLEIDLKENLLSVAVSPGQKALCYLIRNGQINKVGTIVPNKADEVEPMELQSGDIVFAASKNLLHSLVERMVKMTDSDKENDSLPKDFFENEAAVHVLALVNESQRESVSTDLENKETTYNLYPGLLQDNIDTALKGSSQPDPAKKVVVNSFFAYQIP